MPDTPISFNELIDKLLRHPDIEEVSFSYHNLLTYSRSEPDIIVRIRGFGFKLERIYSYIEIHSLRYPALLADQIYDDFYEVIQKYREGR